MSMGTKAAATISRQPVKRPREDEKLPLSEPKKSTKQPQQQLLQKAAVETVPAVVPSQPGKVPNALVVLGTYHSVMAGLAFRTATAPPAGAAAGSTKPVDAKKFLLKFSIKHHVGCVSSVAVCDRYIASSGTDERLFLFTVKDRGGQVADLGSLAPASEVRTLAFQGNQHLVCGCTDGTVSVYRTRDWESVLAVQVHEKSIESLALHPSGALCVTVGLDRFVAMLDMSSGKLITKFRLPPTCSPQQVLFSCGTSSSNADAGEYFAVVGDYNVLVFDTRSGAAKGSITLPKQPPFQIHSACFIRASGATSSTLVLGTESGALYAVGGMESFNEETAIVWTIAAAKEAQVSISNVPEDILQQQATIKDESKKKYPTQHTVRVKSMMLLEGSNVLLTADTNGALIASSAVVDDGDKLRLKYVCSANCQGRVTSITSLTR